MPATTEKLPVALEMVTVRHEGAVLFAEIAASLMNLPGPDLVRILASARMLGESPEG